MKKLKDIAEVIVSYRAMESFGATSMIREVKWQYADMASGGDGGQLIGVGEPITSDADGEPVEWAPWPGPRATCREHNYLGYPDEWFQEVCDLMGWDR